MHPPAGEAGAPLRLRHLWRRRHHPSPHPCDRQPAGGGNQPDPCRASDLRRRQPRRSGRRRAAILGCWRPPHRRPTRRRPARRRLYVPIRTATPMPPTWWPACAASQISRYRSPPIRKPTRRRAARRPIWTTSSASWTPGRPAPSPNISSTAAPILRFLDRALAAGISAPIVPGIMPVSNFAQAAKFSAMCGTSVPGLAGRVVCRDRGRPGDKPHGGRRRRRGAGAPAAGERRG